VVVLSRMGKREDVGEWADNNLAGEVGGRDMAEGGGVTLRLGGDCGYSCIRTIKSACLCP
jgi:hypothetical protein